MLAAPPVPASTRSFYFVMTVASLLVGAAIGAKLAPRRVEARPPEIVMKPEVTPPEPAHFAQPPPPWTTGIEACDLYVAKVEALARCDKFPQEAKDAIHQSLDALKTTLADTSDANAETRRSLVDGCAAAVDAMNQAGPAMGCEL
jgi:hypothetical protein